MRQFEKTFGPYTQSSGAWQQLAQGAWKKYQDKVVKKDKETGRMYIDEDAHDRFLRDYAEPLDQFPELRMAMEKTGTAASNLKAQAAQTRYLKKQHEASQVAVLTLDNNLSLGDRLTIIAESKGKDAVTQSNALLDSVSGNKEARIGLSGMAGKRIREKVLEKDTAGIIGEKSVNGSKLRKILEDRNDPLTKLLTESHRHSLLVYAKQMERIQHVPVRTPNDQSRKTARDFMKEATGTTTDSYAAQLKAVHQDRDSYYNMGVRTTAKWFFQLRAKDAARIEREAFFDTDTAKIQAILARNKNVSPGVARDITNKLFELGYIDVTVGEAYITGMAAMSQANANAQKEQRKRTQGAF